MTTNTPIHETPPALEGKPKKRGLIWLIAFVVVAGVAGYAVYKAGQPNQFVTTTGGGRGGSGGDHDPKRSRVQPAAVSLGSLRGP